MQARYFLIFILILSFVCICGCVSAPQETQTEIQTQTPAAQMTEDLDNLSVTVPVLIDEKFGYTLDITNEEFLRYGFTPGDSVDLAFSNGYLEADVPCVSGSLVSAGTVFAVSDAAESKPKIRDSMHMQNAFNLFEGDTVTVSLHTKQKYAALEKISQLQYEDTPAEGMAPETFANFRALPSGVLKKDLLFRGASSVDDRRGRAGTVNTLLEKYGINAVLNLANTEEDVIQILDENGDALNYAKELHNIDRLISVLMTPLYMTEEFQNNIAGALKRLIQLPGPYYIHCLEGKDRAGFTCLLIEAVCGVPLDDIKADYMQTYANYYGVTKESAPEMYEAALSEKFRPMIAFITKDNTLSLADGARAYLREGGMSDEEIDGMIDLFTV